MCGEGEEYECGRVCRWSGDIVHKERGDAIHLQPYKKPALLPGDHNKRVGCDLLTLSHAILSRQLHVLIEAPRIPRGVDSPWRFTSYYVMHTCHLKVEIRMHVVTLLESGRSIVTKMTERWSALLVTTVDMSLSSVSNAAHRCIQTLLTVCQLLLVGSANTFAEVRFHITITIIKESVKEKCIRKEMYSYVYILYT